MLRNSGFRKASSVDILERVLDFTVATAPIQDFAYNLWLIEKKQRDISVSECIVILNHVSAVILKESTLVVLHIVVVS